MMMTVPDAIQTPQMSTPGVLVAGIVPLRTGVEPPHSVDPERTFERLASIGIPAVAPRDDTVVAYGSPPGDRDRAVKGFRTALDRAGLHAAAVSVDLDVPELRDGALAANRPAVRRLALRRVLASIDLAAELGAPLQVLDARYEPVGRGLEQDVAAALDCYAEAVNACCEYVVDRGYEIELVIAPSPRSLLPTTGHALAFLHELDGTVPVGLAPSLDRGSGDVAFHHEAAQALWADKLFHVGLPGLSRALDTGSGSGSGSGRRDALLLVDLLRDAEWDGSRQIGEVPLGGTAGDSAGEPGPTGQGDGGVGRDGGTDPWGAVRADLAALGALEEAAADLRADTDLAAARGAVGADALDDPTLPDGFSPESFGELRSPDAERDDRDEVPGDDPEARDRLDALLRAHLDRLGGPATT